MRLAFPKIQLRRIGSRDLVPIYCDQCNVVFHKPKNDVLAKIKKRGENCKRYCTPHCASLALSFPERPCKECGNNTKAKFCSQSCAAKFNNRVRARKNKAKLFTCLRCGKQSSNEKFCSRNCHRRFVEETCLKGWREGKQTGMAPAGFMCKTVRVYILKKYEHTCARCGWKEINPTSGKVPVQIEHIDGDFRNCREENLIVLCPNCHSLTPTYMGLNRGRGRDVNGVRRKKQRIAGIAQLIERTLGTGEVRS